VRKKPSFITGSSSAGLAGLGAFDEDTRTNRHSDIRWIRKEQECENTKRWIRKEQECEKDKGRPLMTFLFLDFLALGGIYAKEMYE
jgi:hypothetical protein